MNRQRAAAPSRYKAMIDIASLAEHSRRTNQAAEAGPRKSKPPKCNISHDNKSLIQIHLPKARA